MFHERTPCYTPSIPWDFAQGIFNVFVCSNTCIVPDIDQLNVQCTHINNIFTVSNVLKYYVKSVGGMEREGFYGTNSEYVQLLWLMYICLGAKMHLSCFRQALLGKQLLVQCCAVSGISFNLKNN